MTRFKAKSPSKKQKPIVWTISGADCSGGAGIAADIKTGHNLNVEVCHLITANTVQNSTKLFSINSTPTKILTEQVHALRFDKPPTVIKIGLLVNNEQVIWLTALLSELKKQLTNLVTVYDPVGQASVGGKLSTLLLPDLKPLLPLIDVITPNLNEAEQLRELQDIKTDQSAADNILALGCNAVIIKGGHNLASSNCIDVCWQKSAIGTVQKYQLQSAKIATNDSHGGGCSFATALASFLAHGYLLRDAFTLTKAFINQGLSANVNNTVSNSTDTSAGYYGAFEQGCWPNEPSHFPLVVSSHSHNLLSSSNFPTLGLTAKERLGLYPVIDSLEWLERLLPLNFKIIQLRIKNMSDTELEPIIEKAVALARDYNCRLFINDHWQLAIKYHAYGVHIGQEDLANADLQAIAKAGLRLGISTHGCYEFLLAKQLQPSYLAIGAIFPTKTKDMTGQIQGIENLQHILALSSDIPVVAIGGINEARLPQVWQTGVSSIAVVTAITEAEQPITAVKALQKLVSS